MVESALECIRVCRELDFHNLVISMKASKVPVMMAAYRLLAKSALGLATTYTILWLRQCSYSRHVGGLCESSKAHA
jgi:4-hydroxy-3-methylbut-2-en-1-yl diphosphate synthase IspG/GcpE